MLSALVMVSASVSEMLKSPVDIICGCPTFRHCLAHTSFVGREVDARAGFREGDERRVVVRSQPLDELRGGVRCSGASDPGVISV